MLGESAEALQCCRAGPEKKLVSTMIVSLRAASEGRRWNAMPRRMVALAPAFLVGSRTTTEKTVISSVSSCGLPSLRHRRERQGARQLRQSRGRQRLQPLLRYQPRLRLHFQAQPQLRCQLQRWLLLQPCPLRMPVTCNSVFSSTASSGSSVSCKRSCKGARPGAGCWKRTLGMPPSSPLLLLPPLRLRLQTPSSLLSSAAIRLLPPQLHLLCHRRHPRRHRGRGLTSWPRSLGLQKRRRLQRC